jgi:uncharacterized protein (TIGR02391 family)
MSKDVVLKFPSGSIESISRLLGDSLTGDTIKQFLIECNIIDTDPTITKWKRLYNAIIKQQDINNSGDHLLCLISKALDPARNSNTPNYSDTINRINVILSFHGLEFRDDGICHTVEKSNSLSEAKQRVSLLKKGIDQRKLHPTLLKYCKEELLTENYFHAVFEVVKGLADIIRKKSGVNEDGGKLIDKVFGKNPLLKINSYSTESEKSEQSGFANLLKGLFGTFRNPIAHEPKISWNMSEEDALDLFTLASYLLRRLDTINGKSREL